MENIENLDWEEFWALSEGAKLLYKREAEARARGGR
jgi:hypothetical protein